eukprot:gene16078-18151_t
MLNLVLVLVFLSAVFSFRVSKLESTKNRNVKTPSDWKEIKETRASITKEFRKLKRYNPKYVAALEKANNNKLMETPYFSLFMRPKFSGEWLPISEFTGDKRSKDIIKSWLSAGRDMFKNFFKRQIDKSVAASFFQQKDGIIKNVLEKYEPFQGKSPDDFEFGYKVSYFDADVTTGEQEMTVITDEMTKGWADEIKTSITKLFEPKEDEPEDTTLGATYVLPHGKTEKESILEFWGEDECLGYKEKNGVFPWQETVVTKTIQSWIDGTKEYESEVAAGNNPDAIALNTPPKNEPWKTRNFKAKFNWNSKLGKSELATKNSRRAGYSPVTDYR